MRLNEIEFTDAKPVDGYGPGFFRVAGERLDGPLLMSAAGIKPWAGADDIAALLALAGKVDVVFFGTGAETAFAPRPLRDALEAAGLGVEAMNTPSACRTYNILLSEGRRVALAALPV